ncbi:MAG TPA: hypothetical protein VJT54_02820 [Verrucomicrobiae bacterium]|nr:hypothetical protein [Verrucomicrobiae bacterium]
MNENQKTAKYLVKRPSESEEFSFVATLEQIKAGLKTGQVKPEWGVKNESGGYWMTIHNLIYDPPHPKSPAAPPARRVIKWAALVFITSCLIPPWQFTADRNGNAGFHTRKPAGYSLVFVPPTNPESIDGSTLWFGVQIDFGRLFLEWAALAAVTGMVWILVVKPAWPRDDKANRPQKFTPPTGNPEN